MQARKDLPESAFRQVAVEVLAGQEDADGARAREAVGREVARQLRIRPEIKQAMEEAFAAVLNEFRDVTLQKSAVLESVGRQVHGVTGGQMREFARRLREAAPRPLTEEQILAWADAHHERTGEWPKVLSGPITENPGETWGNIHAALLHGLRELPGGSSLAQFLADRRGVRNPADLPKLTVEQVLAWVDAFHDRTNKWPGQNSGPIDNAPGETWKGVCMAFVQEQRGLPKGFTLAEILAVHRGVRNTGNLPDLSEETILAWADAHYERTGVWPTAKSGHVPDAPAEKWANINAVLHQGGRGLPKGSSLAKLLAAHRGKRNRKGLPPLSEEQIVAWADTYYERIGKWPQDNSGAIDGIPGQTWKGVNVALMKGLRGLPGGSCLTSLLEKHRSARNRMNLPALTEQKILAWADAYYERIGEWPQVKSGPIDEAPGETWLALNHALHRGMRGLPGGSSLAKLLARHRGVRSRMNLPPLTVEEILVWIDGYLERTGRCPNRNSGPIEGCPGETWANVDGALKKGCRDLPGGTSLARLTQQHRASLKS
jgi:hypothetical protein